MIALISSPRPRDEDRHSLRQQAPCEDASPCSSVKRTSRSRKKYGQFLMTHTEQPEERTVRIIMVIGSRRARNPDDGAHEQSP